MSISMIGLDTAKSVFQLHGVDAQGKVQLKRKLRRDELIAFFEQQSRCTVVMEACGAARPELQRQRVDDFEAGEVTVPDYRSLMLPVLSISTNEEVRFGDVVDRLAAPALFQAFEHHHAAGQVDLPGGQDQGFKNSAAGGVQGGAEGAHLARGLGGGGQEGAALLFGEIEAAPFGVEELHAVLGLVGTVHANSVSGPGDQLMLPPVGRQKSLSTATTISLR